MSKEKIIIIDGSSYFFRAFYAIQRLSNSKGFPTNAIFGFINMLMKVLETEKPTKLVIAFDTPKPTFRKEKYSEYKSNRESPPEDLIKQIPRILESVDCFGIKRIEKEGFEADDVIGTLAKKAVKDGYCVDIITGDKDLMQLVNEDVIVFDTMKDMRYDINGVKEKMGVYPHQIVDFLALMGDSSDNIPGVTGIGAKTAVELINNYDSLDGVYKNIELIKQAKRKEALINEKDTAYLSQDLATVYCSVPFPMSWDEFNYNGPILSKLRPFLEEMEFQNLLRKFNANEPEKKKEESKYITIRTESDLIEVCEKIKTTKLLSLDTETTSLNIHSAHLVGISLSITPNEAYYLPIRHCVLGERDTVLPDQLKIEWILKYLKPILENKKIPKLGQNLKYDYQILKNLGIEINGITADTMLESYLSDPEQPHNLDSLAFRHLGHQNITYEEMTGKGKSQILFSEVEIDKATQYAAEDADVTLRIHAMLYPKLISTHLMPLFTDIEVPLLSVLARMEYLGIKVDDQRLKTMSEKLSAEIQKIEEVVYASAGETFNIQSPKQLAHILFEKLKLPTVKKIKTGFSTDESVLQELSEEHEICKHIVKYRELNKLKSTYVDGLLEECHPKTGRVHTHYNQTVTSTGRLSSSNPNLQNIPASENKDYDIRSVFIPEKGYTFLSADYSQVELRLLADMSEDAELLRAFKNNEDIHEFTARLIFHSEEVTPDQRKVAKTINFGVVYGQTPYGLSQTLKISPKEAKEFIELYFERYKGVRKYLDSLKQDARNTGYAVTKLNRRRYISEINSSNHMRKEMAERAAINMPLQGTAADMIKIAMVRIQDKLDKENFKSRMILQVHDELVFEMHDSEKEKLETLVRTEMEGALVLKVPLKVDIGFGNNWRECDE